jgi:hypothetical protein
MTSSSAQADYRKGIPVSGHDLDHGPASGHSTDQYPTVRYSTSGEPNREG